MQEVTNLLETTIKSAVDLFLEKSKDKETYIISHFDTDGITSASIMIQTLKEMDKQFSIKIIKSLEKEFIDDLPKNKVILFLDLASGSLDHIANSNLQNVFIIDHHEINQEIPENVTMVNPENCEKQKISGSCLTYLFCKQINPNKKLAKLAILGMIGDQLEKKINKLNNNILNEGEVKRKRGLLIYPSTRPINRTLEFCSRPYIPGVTGDTKGVQELLRETGLTPQKGGYKSLMEINEDEMERLVTAIILRNPKTKHDEMIGDIFLIKLFNKLEDARELSAKINACSRFGESGIAIQLCMEIPKAKKIAEKIYAKYKQLLISGLKFASETKKITGNGFVIINARDNIKETMIGTIASILSYSGVYEEGTTIVTMAYYDKKIKISARSVGTNIRNLREVLSRVINTTGGEVGGHQTAAGGIITQDKEDEFLNLLKKNLEIEVVRI
ncbi:MAG: DHH family phosphoesterase [archaeon]